MKRIISSLSEGNDNKNSWEKVFEILSEKLLSNENTNEVKTAKNILHSYIKSLEPYERSIILSGIMVSSKQGRKSKDFNTGKALKTFIESMNDPALVKLGQAISSYPGTPESIRKEMMELKSNANKPSRWEIFELIENNKIIPEKVKKEIEYLGEVLGSASYWFIVKTLKKNNNKSALGFLRYKVKEKADYGFKVLEKTVEDLLEKAKKMKKKEKNDTISLCNSLSKMIKSSKEMAEIETNVEIGHEQWQKAHDIYNGQLFKANNNTTFKIHVAKWNSYSQTHKDMEAVNGIHFNDLPEETEEEKTLKNQIAKIYAQIEFTQLFKGEEIDYDRHGAQMKVDIISDKDEKFITINLFDHGSMVLEHPGSKEKKVFGKVFSKMIVNSLLGKDPAQVLDNEIKNIEKKDKLNAKKNISYLLNIQKGLLALYDFTKYLSKEDLKDVIISAIKNGPIDKDIQKGFNPILKMIMDNIKSSENIKIKQKEEEIIKEAKRIVSERNDNNDNKKYFDPFENQL
jgi:hypothetical protein